MSSVYTPLLASARQATDGVLPTVSAPEDPDAPSEISWLQSFRSALLSSKVNLLLLFVPLGIVAGELGWSDAAIFSLNFLAIIPLASLLGLATEELALRVGQTIGGLLNATFGNAVELVG